MERNKKVNRKKQEKNEKNCKKIQRIKKKRKGGFGLGINYQATVEKVDITQTDALSQEIG